MAEILLMKAMKILLSIVCYSGSGIVLVDQELEGAIIEALQINPTLQKIILYLLIFLWVIKIIWFVIDKILQYQERKQAMRKKEDEKKS